MSTETRSNRGPWAEGIWSKWAVNVGIGLPPISPMSPDLLPGLIDRKIPLASRVDKDRLEYSFSQTIVDYMEENKGSLPPWAHIYKDRSGYPMLTPRRDKKLVGYIIEPNQQDYLVRLHGNRDAIHEFFYSSAFILTPNKDDSYSHLENMGVSCIEKEFLRSRGKRLLVFRYLNYGGKVIRISSVRWDKGNDGKSIRIEDPISGGEWKVVKETTTSFEEDSKDLDGFVLSL